MFSIVLVGEALPLLGGAEYPCIVLVNEALPLLGGGQNIHVFY